MLVAPTGGVVTLGGDGGGVFVVGAEVGCVLGPATPEREVVVGAAEGSAVSTRTGAAELEGSVVGAAMEAVADAPTGAETDGPEELAVLTTTPPVGVVEG